MYHIRTRKFIKQFAGGQNNQNKFKGLQEMHGKKLARRLLMKNMVNNTNNSGSGNVDTSRLLILNLSPTKVASQDADFFKLDEIQLSVKAYVLRRGSNQKSL